MGRDKTRRWIKTLHDGIPSWILDRIGFFELVEINKLEGTSHTPLHAGGQKIGINAIEAHAALFGVLFFLVEAGSTVRAGPHAVGTADAPVLMMKHDAVASFLIGGHRAGARAGRVVAVIAGQREKSAFAMWIDALGQRIDLAPHHAGVELIEVLAGHRTAAAADALVHIQKKGISLAHRLPSLDAFDIDELIMDGHTWSASFHRTHISGAVVYHVLHVEV